MQVYAPTSDHADREVEDFYDDITLALNDTKTHYNILIGDFNAKMGKRTDDTETSLGKFGLGNRNERGETLLSFLLEKNLFQMNSFFYKKDHRRWTWRSPDGKTKNEIDFMITDKKQIFRNVTVLNQFSTGSDHRMLKACIETDLGKERYRMTKKKPRCTWTDPRSINTFEEDINTILENKKGADQNVNTLNNVIIEAIEESQKIHCQEKSNNKRLSPETQALMEERRKMQSDKSKEHHQLREINKKISKSIRKDNRKHKTEQIQQTIEENKSLKVLRRRLTNGKKEIIKLKNKDRTVTTNREELLRIVEEFYTELYRSRQNHKEKQTEKLDKSEKIVINQGSEEMPSISTDEIRNALKKMKKNKAPGEDNIVIEAVKIGGDRLLENIKELFNLCLHQSETPTRWQNALTILLHKKGDPTDLENYRPISLLNHLYKLFTRIITDRLETKLDFYQPKEQAGFRKNFGTNDHLHCIKGIIEKSIEYNRPLVLAFVDFRKAFDTIEFNSIMKALEESRIDYRYSRLIKNIYNNATMTVRLHKDTKCIKINRGIRQGDTLSPKLFTAVLEHAFKQLDWDTNGIKVDGEMLSHLRFADDIVLMGDNLKTIGTMLAELDAACKEVGLNINFGKTQFMTNLVPSENLKVDDKEITLVHKYKYLGHEIQIARDNQTTELQRRITLAWAAYGALSDIFKSSIPNHLKKKTFDQCILPVMTYGAETLSLTQATATKLRVAQRGMERSMLGLTLRDRVRNEEIRRRTGVTDVIERIAWLKWNWAGHVARMTDGRWTRKVIEWRPRADKRNRGRPPTRWTDDVKRIAGNWLQKAQDRPGWKKLGEAYVQLWTQRAG